MNDQNSSQLHVQMKIQRHAKKDRDQKLRCRIHSVFFLFKKKKKVQILKQPYGKDQQRFLVCFPLQEIILGKRQAQVGGILAWVFWGERKLKILEGLNLDMCSILVGLDSFLSSLF